MEKLLSLRDIMERYQCSRQTAARYMRQMEHMEEPLRVTEKALNAWERSRTRRPAGEIRRKMLQKKVSRRSA